MTGAEKLRRSLGCALSHMNNAFDNPASEEVSERVLNAMNAARTEIQLALTAAREEA